jgi:hypothetical protein
MKIKANKKLFLIPGTAAYIFLMTATLLWAYWGVGEVFHEGWYAPYAHIVFYFIPFLSLLGITILCIYLPLIGGILIILVGLLFLVLTVIKSEQQYVSLLPSFWMVSAVVIIPGLLFISDYILKGRRGYYEYKKTLFKNRWKLTIALILSFILIIGVGTPLLIRNLGRLPLDSCDEVTIKGNGITLTLAGEGPGWYYSNTNPIVFKGGEYRAFSWNEIALFGKDPVGFEGKMYSPDYDGTGESIYFATQEDFDRYNMFRYINCSGDELTDEVQDCWRLPAAEEYVRLFMYRGENSEGYFDITNGKAYYGKTPDKEGPIWAPDEMVIYYWTSTSFNDQYAYDIAYSGEIREILKTTKQDYRGWRAVKIEK